VSTDKSHSVKNIAKRIREYRDREDVTQTQLAHLLGLKGGNYIYQIEAGKKEPGESLIRLFETFERASFAKIATSHSSPRVQEDSTAWESQSMAPPHVLPRATKPGPAARSKTPHENYAEAVSILGELLENKPEALEALMFTLRAVHETQKEKK
jgi:transcriptional regulator with XRE-family HTH domain